MGSDVPGIDSGADIGILSSGDPTHLPAGPGWNGGGVSQVGTGHTGKHVLSLLCPPEGEPSTAKHSPMFPNNRNPDDYKKPAL